MAIGAVERVDRRGLDDRLRLALGDEVDVAGDGHAVRVTWAPVAGANAAEVSSATLTIRPALARRSFPDLLKTACQKAGSASIAAPAGYRLVALSLPGLTVFRPEDPAEGAAIRTTDDLNARGLRLVVSPSGGKAPLHAIPAVGTRGMIPASLGGASFAAPSVSAPGVLSLPQAPASVALSLATGGVPEEFAPQTMSLSAAPGEAVIGPRNLSVTGPDGAAVWAFPAEMPEGSEAQVDLRLALEKEFGARLANGGALEATFTLDGDDPSRAFVAWSGARGALRRDVPGVTKIALEGAPRALPFDAPLAAEAPGSVRCGLYVTYAGLRLSDIAADPLPAPSSVVEGIVLRPDAPARRTLPPVLRGEPPVARVGLYGRAPEDCEIALAWAAPGAAPQGSPGVVRLAASSVFDLCWAVLPAPPAAGAHELVVRVNKGRFFWAAGASGPLVRLAVSDPDPGGRPLTLGGARLLEVTAARHEIEAASLPAAVFRGAAPRFESTLFLQVEIADLALRYPR